MLLTLSLGNYYIHVAYADRELNIVYFGPPKGFRNAVWFNGTDAWFEEEAANRRVKNKTPYYDNLLLELAKDEGERRPFSVSGTDYGPRGLLGLVLRKVRRDVLAEVRKEKLKSPDYGSLKVLLTVPSYISDDSLIKDIQPACYMAGLDVVGILREPVAACVAYQIAPEDRQRALFIDIGSTLKLAVVEGIGHDYSIIAQQDQLTLGFEDFFSSLFGYLVGEFKKKNGRDLTRQAKPSEEHLFRRRAEVAFGDLVAGEKCAAFKVDFDIGDLEVVLSLERRTKKQAMPAVGIGEFLFHERCFANAVNVENRVRAFLDQHGIASVDCVLPCGNIAAIPPIVERLEGSFAEARRPDYDRDKIIAAGATLYYQSKTEKNLEQLANLSEHDATIMGLLESVCLDGVGRSPAANLSPKKESKSQGCAEHLPAAPTPLLAIGQRLDVESERVQSIAIRPESSTISLVACAILKDTPGSKAEVVRGGTKGSWRGGVSSRGDGVILIDCQILAHYAGHTEVRIFAMSTDSVDIGEKAFGVSLNDGGRMLYGYKYPRDAVRGSGGAIQLLRIYKHRESWKIEATQEPAEAEVRVALIPLRATGGRDRNTQMPAPVETFLKGEKILIRALGAGMLSVIASTPGISLVRIEKGKKRPEEKTKATSPGQASVEVDSLDEEGVEEVLIYALSADAVEIGRKVFDVALSVNGKPVRILCHKDNSHADTKAILLLRFYRYRQDWKVSAEDERVVDPKILALADGQAVDKEPGDARMGNASRVIRLGEKRELKVAVGGDLQFSVDSGPVLLSVRKSGATDKSKKEGKPNVRVSLNWKDLLGNPESEAVVTLHRKDGGLLEKDSCSIGVTCGGGVGFQYRSDGSIRGKKVILFRLYQRKGTWWIRAEGDRID